MATTTATAGPSHVASEKEIAQKAAVFQRLHPRAYFERFIKEGFRPDGRESFDWRDLSVNVGSISTADGSALVRLGDTTVVCGVKAEIAEPELDSPEHGFLVPNLDLTAMCSPRFKPGPPTEEAQVLSERLAEVLLSSECVPLSSLCIKAGKAVWVLYVDAVCINYDGNAFDATLIAMLAALKNTRLPSPRYEDDTGRTFCSRKTKTPLRINSVPLSVSFGIYDGARILADPTAFEEPLLSTSLSIVLNERNQLISVSHSGPSLNEDALAQANSQDVLVQCIAIATARRSELSEIVDKLT